MTPGSSVAQFYPQALTSRFFVASYDTNGVRWGYSVEINTVFTFCCVRVLHCFIYANYESFECFDCVREVYSFLFTFRIHICIYIYVYTT